MSTITLGFATLLLPLLLSIPPLASSASHLGETPVIACDQSSFPTPFNTGACVCWVRRDTGGIIDCRNLGLKTFPMGIPSSLKYQVMDESTGFFKDEQANVTQVWMSGNEFSTVPADGLINVRGSLKILYLNNNPSLTTLEAGSLHNMDNLHTLLIHHTSLQALPVGIFDDLTSVKELWLHSNALSTLDATTFQGPSASILTLKLQGNDLQPPLPLSLFANFKKLKNLDLRDNNNLTHSSIGCLNLCELDPNLNIRVQDDFSLLCSNDKASTTSCDSRKSKKVYSGGDVLITFYDDEEGAEEGADELRCPAETSNWGSGCVEFNLSPANRLVAISSWLTIVVAGVVAVMLGRI
jgi:hypothetical protein